MKKYIPLVLAILLALLAYALPASAESAKDRRDHRSDRHRGGYVIPIPQVYVGDGYYETYYGSRHYGHGLSVRDVIGAAVVIGGVVAVEKIADHHRDDDSVAKEMAKCHKNVTKDYAKRNISLTVEQIDAICHGQPLSELTPPAPKNGTPPISDLTDWDYRKSELTPASTPTPTVQTPRVPAPPVVSLPAVAAPARLGVYAKNGRIHNDSSKTATIFVDGKVEGTLAPGGTVSIAELPKGKLDYRY